jgi:hypothetical protein
VPVVNGRDSRGNVEVRETLRQVTAKKRDDPKLTPAQDRRRVLSGMSGSIRGQSGRGCVVPDPNENPNAQNPADWAVDQATAELYDVDDPDVISERAQELVREAEQREDERHDEYDDPDQGGEA